MTTSSLTARLDGALALAPVATTPAMASDMKHRTAAKPAAGDIVDVAAKAGSFKTLIAAAKAAGLVPALKGKGPISVFAPTDAAFAKLPKGTVAMLLKPENKAKQQAILKYHVVAGKAPAAATSRPARPTPRPCRARPCAPCTASARAPSSSTAPAWSRRTCRPPTASSM